MPTYDDNYKEVYFAEYCKTCKYEKTPEVEMPCTECLDYPVNLYSHKPINWKGKDGYEDYVAPERGTKGETNA